jgi:hypothetical protein
MATVPEESNDPETFHVKHAVERERGGHGPTLLEAGEEGGPES